MSLRVEIEKKLGNFSMQIRFDTAEKRIGFLGPSGSGKSMTLKMIAGIEVPDSGSIIYEGRILFDSKRRVNVRPQKRKVGYLFQNYALFPNMTVEENIGCSLKKDRRKDIVDEMIRKFHLEELRKKLPGMLSGGQQQRVALARIMAYSPEMILLDEPFSALDVYLKDRMQQELEELLADYPGTVIMVSHDREEIYRFSSALCVISAGKIEASGNTKEIFRASKTEIAARLTGCKNVTSARRIDAHTLWAEGWGISLHFRKDIPENCGHVGIRAHDLVPVWGKPEENCIPFSLYETVELQFETKYYIRPQKETFESEDLINWFVQRDMLEQLQEKGMPDYLRFDEKDMMLLE